MKYLLLLFVLVFSVNVASSQKKLPIGSKAPNFKAITNKGEKVELKSILENEKVVLMFYRGQWCPYCNQQMSELQDSLHLIEQAGAKVLAVTPEKPSEMDKTVEKTGAKYDLIYDKGHKIMDLYQVTFDLPKVKRLAYKIWGIDINEASGNEDNALPVPATYVIDKNGKILSAYFNENYKERMTVIEILNALK